MELPGSDHREFRPGVVDMGVNHAAVLWQPQTGRFSVDVVFACFRLIVRKRR